MNVTLHEDEILKAIIGYLAFKKRFVKGQWSATIIDNKLSITVATEELSPNTKDLDIINYLKSDEKPDLN